MDDNIHPVGVTAIKSYLTRIIDQIVMPCGMMQMLEKFRAMIRDEQFQTDMIRDSDTIAVVTKLMEKERLEKERLEKWQIKTYGKIIRQNDDDERGICL